MDTCVCGIATGLNKALVCFAPRVPMLNSEEMSAPSEYPLTKEVVEPDDKNSFPPLPTSSLLERIPCCSGVPEILKPRIQRLSKEIAAVLAGKVVKRRHKPLKKKCPQSKPSSSICRVSCSSATIFYDHTHFWAHQIQVEIKSQLRSGNHETLHSSLTSI